MTIAYPMMVGTKVKITKGIYTDRIVRIAEVVSRIDLLEGNTLFGYAVVGLGAFEGTKLSTIWDDEIERV